MKQVTLICNKVVYYTNIDEDMFFAWIDRIKSIKSFELIDYDLLLHFSSAVVPDNDFRALIGLFYRYKIDMKQLQVFINDNNTEWVCGEPKGYWYRRMFGSPTKK